jgi:hypothetical protein
MENMCRLLNKIYLFFIFYVLSTIFICCGFIDLRPIGVFTFPNEAGAILSDTASPVSVSFDTNMRTEEIERIFGVDFSGGKVEGDFHWDGDGRQVYFYPAAGWQAGIRYMLSLNGGAYSIDGRDADFSVFVPFYVINNEDAPYLKSFYPDDGASIGVLPEDGGKVQLFFSTSMDKRSVEDAFSIDGIINKKLNWNNLDTEVEIVSTDILSAWSVYRWTLGTKARSATGVPLPKTYSAQFTANKDTAIPVVKYAAPVSKVEVGGGVNKDGYYWMETGGEIENNLGFSQSISIVFSKPMDKNSVVSGFRIEPSIPIIVEQYSPATFVFSPLRALEPGTLYRLTVSEDTKDLYGLKLANEYALNFTIDIPHLTIISIRQYGSNTQLTDITNKINENVISLKISEASKECKLSFQFFPAVDDIESQKNIARSIKLDPFFPGTIENAVLRWAYWTGNGNDTLVLEWDYVSPGTETQPHFYKLTIPGGLSGISNGSGSFLQDTITVYLEIIGA